MRRVASSAGWDGHGCGHDGWSSLVVVVAQVGFVVRAYWADHKEFAFQMFPESSTWQADVVRVTADGRRIPVTEPWAGLPVVRRWCPTAAWPTRVRDATPTPGSTTSSRSSTPPSTTSPATRPPTRDRATSRPSSPRGTTTTSPQTVVLRSVDRDVAG